MAGTALRRGFKSWAEKEATRQRSLLGLRPEAPLRARDLAGRLGVPIVDPQRLPGLAASDLSSLFVRGQTYWSAVTIFPQDQPLILLNTAHSRARKEADLMHELAHLICGHKPEKMVRVPGLPLPLRDYDPVQEGEADWLGGCLMLPKVALIWAHYQGMTPDLVTSHFTASSQMVRFRRNVTGVGKLG